MKLLENALSIAERTKKELDQLCNILTYHLEVYGPDVELPENCNFEERMFSIYEKITWIKFIVAKVISIREKEKILDNLQRPPQGLIAGYPDMPRAEATYIENVLTMKIPLIPDLVKNKKKPISRANGDKAQLWNGLIRYAYSSLDAKPKFQKALIVITVHRPKINIPWNPDNLCINTIIDAVKYCGIIQDDSYHYMEYMVRGREAEKMPMTVISIVENDNTNIILNSKKDSIFVTESLVPNLESKE